VPELSRFYGIIIRMFFNDHGPPHFHAVYGRQAAIIAIESLAVIDGSLPPRALGMVMEWAALHQPELMDRWRHAQSLQPLEKIEPLP
jgi:hypothetical protein